MATYPNSTPIQNNTDMVGQYTYSNNLSQREKKIIAFNNRKSSNNNKKHKNKKNKKSNSNNYKLNSNLTETERMQIYNSLLKAICNCNKLSDNELKKIFQNAMDKLNVTWFRTNLPLLFNNINNNTNQNIDIVSLILRLFTINFESKNRKYHVPFRYFLLDMIIPSIHSRPNSHKTCDLIDPLPLITEFHRLYAKEIFSIWLLQMTSNIPTNNMNNEILYNKILSKNNKGTLDFFRLDEMECLFYGFNLSEILSNKIINRLCDKIYHLINIENNNALACKWVIYFNLFNYIPYELLLTPLLTTQSSLQCVLHYINSIDSNNIMLKNNIKYFILTTICTFLHDNKTSISPAKAIKLVEKWKFDIRKFDELIIAQIKLFIGWIISRGHIDDYAQLFGEHYEVLKYFIIKQCFKHITTYKSSIKWAEYWGLQNDPQFKNIIENTKLKIQNNNEMNFNNNKSNEFIKGFDDVKYCNINTSQIVWIMNDINTLQKAYNILLNKDIKCIGLDLELMAIDLPLKNKPKHCQILQVSTDNISFIFDLQLIDEMNNKNMFQLFDELLHKIFSESNAIKIGIGWKNDLKYLRKQYPNAIAFKSICTPYFDLNNISQYIKSNKIKGIEINEIKEKNIKNRFKKKKDKEGGLAKITRLILNKRLNKFEQISNWSNRPLRFDQLKYAALDAMVPCWIWNQCVQWENENILPPLPTFYQDLCN